MPISPQSTSLLMNDPNVGRVNAVLNGGEQIQVPTGERWHIDLLAAPRGNSDAQARFYIDQNSTLFSLSAGSDTQEARASSFPLILEPNQWVGCGDTTNVDTTLMITGYVEEVS